MCLVVAAWNAHRRYRLVVAANRDEFHARPAAPAAFWRAHPQLLAGQDLQAGGAWFGVDRGGRFGVITNFRDLARAHPTAPSRGRFIPDFLTHSDTASEFLSRIEVDAPAYAGFSLLLADATGLWFASNRADQFARRLDPGIYGLSNHLLDTPWPKLLRTRRGLAHWLASEGDADEPPLEPLFRLLADRSPADISADLQGGMPAEWAQALSSPFVNHAGYGTRCTTLLLIDNAGRTHFRERRFDAAGKVAGESAYDLAAPRSADARIGVI